MAQARELVDHGQQLARNLLRLLQSFVTLLFVVAVGGEDGLLRQLLHICLYPESTAFQTSELNAWHPAFHGSCHCLQCG